MRGVCLLTLSALLVISPGMGKFFLVDTYDSKGNVINNDADTNKPDNIDKMRDSKRYDNFVEKEDNKDIVDDNQQKTTDNINIIVDKYDEDIKDKSKSISKIIDTKENNIIAETEPEPEPYHKIEEIINDVTDKDNNLIMDDKSEPRDDNKTYVPKGGSKDTKSEDITNAEIQLPDLHRISIKKNNKDYYLR